MDKNQHMQQKFTLIAPEKIQENAIEMIGYEWMLIAAGSKDDYNMMTAAWGGLGYLWQYPVAFIFIRPQRFTFEFTEKYEHFTLNFFDKQYRKALSYCGVHSGRDVDKANECGLTLKYSDNGTIAFNEARLILECKKVYHDDIKPENFTEDQAQKIYPTNDFHRMYIGRIEKCLLKV